MLSPLHSRDANERTRTPMLCFHIAKQWFYVSTTSLQNAVFSKPLDMRHCSMLPPKSLHSQRRNFNPFQSGHTLCLPPLDKVIAFPNNQCPLSQRSPCILRARNSLSPLSSIRWVLQQHFATDSRHLANQPRLRRHW
jgi:hypothetical protein